MSNEEQKRELPPLEYAFVDVETTGLNAKHHQCIEIAITRCKPDLTVIESFDSLIAMWPGSRLRAESKALEVNGYTDEEWKNASYPNLELWTTVERLTRDAVLISQNVEFDKEWISQSMNHFGINLRSQRRCVDIQSYSALIGEFFGVKSWGLDAAYTALGGPELPTKHRARTDVQRAMYIYAFARKMFQYGLGRGLHNTNFLPTTLSDEAYATIRCLNQKHHDKHPSMRVNMKTMVGKCLSCGVEMSVTAKDLESGILESP